MRRLLIIARRFVIISAVIWVAVAFLLLVVLDLPLLFALPLATGAAGTITWLAVDLAFVPDELEKDARRAMEDRSRRSFLDEIRRQGPGPRPKGGQG